LKLDSILLALEGALKSPLDQTESDWDETMAVNLKAPWLVARAVAQRMKASEKQGSVLFVSYISGLERGYYPGVSVHGTALAGLHQLSKVMLNWCQNIAYANSLSVRARDDVDADVGFFKIVLG
jgi:NAD(P)-dependent dehydrogenase (short-subunit alcohol dehydrogenase family)